MFEEYRLELKRQHKKFKDLADYLGMTTTAVSKKINGVNPWRLDEVYGAMEFIGKPLADIPLYFPRKVVDMAC